MQIVIFSSPSRLEMLKKLKRELEGLDVAVIDELQTFGKEKFWLRWKRAREICLSSKYDDYLIIPDDVSNIDLKEIENIFTLFKEKEFTCNLLNDNRVLPCWNSFENFSKNIQTANYKYACLNYFDCGGLTNRATLKKVSVERIPSDWFDDKNKSSGVGYQLTTKLRALNIPMFTPSPTLAEHGNHDSLMHPIERLKTPLICKRPMKKIANIATFKGRESFLSETLKSIEGQFDEVNVYDNEKEKVDLTDNGKFFFLKKYKEPVYYFTLDDDIIYPSTYSKDMVREIEKTQSIVTIHGRQLGATCNSYYRNPLNVCFHCNSEQPKRVVLDVAGTGVAAFRTDYFNPKNIYKSKDKRMSDLVFSYQAAIEGKKIVLMPHKEKYIKIQDVPIENTIFGQERNNNDYKQAEYQNKIIMAKKEAKSQKQAPNYPNKMVSVYIERAHHKMGYVQGTTEMVTLEMKKKLVELGMVKDEAATKKD